MKPRRDHKWQWAYEETALEFGFPIDQSILPPDRDLHPAFQKVCGSSSEEVHAQICQLTDGVEADSLRSLRSHIASLKVDSIWTHYNDVWVRLEGDPPLFISVFQHRPFCEFPFDQFPAFFQFCSRFDGFFHSHRLCGNAFSAPTAKVTKGDYDPHFGYNLTGWLGSVPFYHDGGEIAVFHSPDGRVGFTCESSGMIDSRLTFDQFIEQYVSDILVSAQPETVWFSNLMITASSSGGA